MGGPCAEGGMEMLELGYKIKIFYTLKTTLNLSYFMTYVSSLTQSSEIYSETFFIIDGKPGGVIFLPDSSFL